MHMSQQLTVELSDEVYTDLQQKAEALGLSVTEWVVAVLGQQENGVINSPVSAEQQHEARQKFRSYAGVLSLGYPTDIDNESIDADLAKAYANEF